MASVKNFQLVSSYPLSDYPDAAAAHEELVKEDSSLEVMLQLGKVFDPILSSSFVNSLLSLARPFFLILITDNGRLF
jgi:hypothetical protein